MHIDIDRYEKIHDVGFRRNVRRVGKRKKNKKTRKCTGSNKTNRIWLSKIEINEEPKWNIILFFHSCFHNCVVLFSVVFLVIFSCFIFVFGCFLIFFNQFLFILFIVPFCLSFSVFFFRFYSRQLLFIFSVCFTTKKKSY